MTFLQGRTTRVLLCVVLFFVASGFATLIPVNNPSFEDLPLQGLLMICGQDCQFRIVSSARLVAPRWAAGFQDGQ